VYLKVANRGEAAADNVQVEIDGTDIEEHERFNRFRPGETVESLRLEPNGSITRHYTISLDTSLREHSISITWKDPSGQEQHESTQSYIEPCS
jgi:ferredoxin-NADP reductase